MQGRADLDPERAEAGLLVEVRHERLAPAEPVGFDAPHTGEVEVEELVAVAGPAERHRAVDRLDETFELVLAVSHFEAQRVLAPGHIRMQKRRLDTKEPAELVFVGKRVHVVLARDVTSHSTSPACLKVSPHISKGRTLLPGPASHMAGSAGGDTFGDAPPT